MISKSSFMELLEPTPIARISDFEIWSQLVSPNTQSLLGKVVSSSTPVLLEHDKPLFPGDEVTNLNNHKLYGGQPGYVRFPYLASIHKTENGAFVVKRDGVKFKGSCWFGDIDKGNAELIYKVGLRDRRYDGTLRANDSAVMDFYYDEAENKPVFGELRSLEVSIYAFLPKSRIFFVTGDKEYEAFVGNPFKFLDRPELFRSYFDRAWKAQLSPGQIAAPIPDVARFIAPRFTSVASKRKYDFLEDAASHYHVAMFAYAAGFRCTFEDQFKELSALTAGIQKIKAAGYNLTRSQESWVCVLQCLKPIDLVPEHLRMGGPIWVQDNISQHNLWMNKPLSKRANEGFPAPLKR